MSPPPAHTGPMEIWDTSSQSAGYREQEIHNALPVPPRRAQVDAVEPIPVRLRVVWEKDGQEFLDTVALGWTRRIVRVQVYDVRSRIVARWFAPEDVRRRADI